MQLKLKKCQYLLGDSGIWAWVRWSRPSPTFLKFDKYNKHLIILYVITQQMKQSHRSNLVQIICLTFGKYFRILI